MSEALFGALLGALATIAGTVVALLGGIALAGGQQDREAHRRLRSVARAVLADVERIAATFDNRGESWHGLDLHGVRIEGPRIHPWIVGVIPEMAAADLAIVRGLMQLDVLLENDRARADAIERHVMRLVEIGTEIEALGTRRVEFDGGSMLVPRGRVDEQSERGRQLASLEAQRADIVEAKDQVTAMRADDGLVLHRQLAELRKLLVPIALAKLPSLLRLLEPRVSEDEAIERAEMRELLARYR